MSLSAEAPRLVDWITLTEAAEKLGVTKQAVHRMVAKSQLHTLHKIGSRPVYVVSETEVGELNGRRIKAKADRAQRATLKRIEEDQRRRVQADRKMPE